ncbi:MAG: sensor histidine kinase [Vicinamibacterales bacterium]
MVTENMQGIPADEVTRAFHAHVATLNRRRIVPLTLGTAALLALGAVGNLVSSGSVVRANLAGLALAVLVLALVRWSPRPGFAALVYGYTVLAWGASEAAVYLVEAELGHAAHAASHLALFFVTRYLASISILWRPRDLAIALAANHLLVVPLLREVSPLDAWVYGPVWTGTAWLAALLIYRAQRDAFAAQYHLRQQRDALEAANAHLERLNVEKNDLMAIAAHDLRSPLMGMSALLRLAAEEAGRAWAGGVATLQALERSCHEMASLVTRVLDAHGAEDRLGPVALEPRDARPVLAGVVASHRPRAEEKGIALRLDLPDQGCVARVDEQALTRVLDNLLSNAIKFSEPGGQVTARLAAGGGAVVFTVSDSGPGIAESERPRLFRRFARLRARPTSGESSSGLGLYISKRLVDAMGGRIEVAAGADPGATFVVTLPAASA